MRVPLLNPQDEITLAARIKKGDSEARAWMIKANLRLVVKRVFEKSRDFHAHSTRIGFSPGVEAGMSGHNHQI